jgi:hypothetical protein
LTPLRCQKISSVKKYAMDSEGGRPFFNLDFCKFLSQNTKTALNISTSIEYGAV